jgi:peptidoglycan/xylan/chitin deacetylase (PgdA/CDA1 family)
MIAAIARNSMRRRRHITLIFHRILPALDPMSPSEPDTAWFDELIGYLVRRFEIIPLREALERAAARTLDGRTLSITFDDGYADNFTQALPVLERHGAPATFFVASSYIDGGRMWNDSIIETLRRLPEGQTRVEGFDEGTLELNGWDSRNTAASRIINAWKHLPPTERQSRVDRLAERVSGLPDDLMMTREQLRGLAASRFAEIGGHTRTHPILAAIDDASAASEIEGGKRDLEEWTQQEVRLFAYPNGKLGRDYAAEHAAIARAAGFEAALATDWGTLDASTDPFAIPRFTPWHRDLGRFTLDLARCHHGLL